MLTGNFYEKGHARLISEHAVLNTEFRFQSL